MNLYSINPHIKISILIIFICLNPIFSESISNDKFDIGIKKMESAACNGCHSLYTKQRVVGPGFKGLFNSLRPLSNGKQRIADQNYLKEAITLLERPFVSGFPGIMHPKYEFSEAELESLIYTLKKL